LIRQARPHLSHDQENKNNMQGKRESEDAVFPVFISPWMKRQNTTRRTGQNRD